MPWRCTGVAGASGDERHPDLAWSVTAYVCHVGDNLRVWAERLAGVAAGQPRTVTPYDQDLLALVRSYQTVGLAGALFSLERATGGWREAVAQAASARVVLFHPDRGHLSVAQVTVHNAHDVEHHQMDIRRWLAHDAVRVAGPAGLP